MSEELCTNCGAPRAAGYAACRFCKTPFAGVGNTQQNAIPCPRCQTLNEVGAQKCVQCQTWIVVQCVFCHALSPHNVPGCQKCGEAFAGAPERFAARQREQHVQQGLQIAGTVGNVAASFLGAAAGAGLFSGHEHHHHHGGEWGQNYDPSYDQGSTGANISTSNDGGGFLGSLFGSSDGDSGGTGANISTSDDSGSTGGGVLDSLFGGSDSSSSDSGDSGGSWGSNDDS